MRKKGIVRLTGGLGNQMFQYAFARYLEIIHEREITFDISFYKNRDGAVRHLDIVKYDLSSHVFHTCNVYEMLRRVFQRIPVLRWIVGTYKERAPFESDIRISKYNYLYYTGYWQNISYITDIQDTIKEEFIYSGRLNQYEKEILAQMNMTDSIAVHVRYGDYLSKKNKGLFYIQNETYYRGAINKAIKECFTPKDDSNSKKCSHKIFFFSDDITQCKDRYGDIKDSVFVDSKITSAITDMMLIGQSRCIIMSNSTFSWWAAYLAKREDVTVFAPQNWYRNVNVNAHCVEALILPDWIVC